MTSFREVEIRTDSCLFHRMVRSDEGQYDTDVGHYLGIKVDGKPP